MKNKRIKVLDDDIGLIGICIEHPRSQVPVIEWRGNYFYLDASQIDRWSLNQRMYFYPDKSHAFEVKPFE